MLYHTMASLKEVMGGAIENFPPGINWSPTSVVRSARRVARDSGENPAVVQVAQYGVVTFSGQNLDHYRFEPLDSYRPTMNRNLPALIEGDGLP